MGDSAFVASAIALAWISFITFLGLTAWQLGVVRTAAKEVQGAATETANHLAKLAAAPPETKPLADFDPAKLFESAAKLVDSLTKAGPGLAALGASVLFLAIAAYGLQKPASGAPQAGGAATTTDTNQKNGPAK